MTRIRPSGRLSVWFVMMRTLWRRTTPFLRFSVCFFVAARLNAGGDFGYNTRRLRGALSFAAKGRVGKAMTEAVAKALQARMFECGDGVWLFPQMVMDDAA